MTCLEPPSFFIRRSYLPFVGAPHQGRERGYCLRLLHTHYTTARPQLPGRAKACYTAFFVRPSLLWPTTPGSIPERDLRFGEGRHYTTVLPFRSTLP